MLDKLSRYAIRFLEVVSVLLFFSLLVSVCLAVIDRFLLHVGFFWTEELARFLFIWLGSLTAAIMVYHRGHFAVPYVIDKILKGRSKQLLDLLISLIMIVLMIVLLIYGIKFAEFGRAQVSPALRISMAVVYYSVPVGSVAMIFFWAIQIIAGIKTLFKSL